MKLVIDMNLSPAWVEFLDSAGHSAVHWATVGAPTATDREIMAWAARQDSVVLTHDLDFSGILAATGGHKPSVVQIRADNLSTGAIGDVILAALDQLGGELATGALVTIEPHRTQPHRAPVDRLIARDRRAIPRPPTARYNSIQVVTPGKGLPRGPEAPYSPSPTVAGNDPGGRQVTRRHLPRIVALHGPPPTSQPPRHGPRRQSTQGPPFPPTAGLFLPAAFAYSRQRTPMLGTNLGQ
ncbi:MAG: DUF5615 family PIN-like protein [Chromatiales bacterium]|nr:DUF5615 family PIN-like protein [Chromatiales bacterium]